MSEKVLIRYPEPPESLREKDPELYTFIMELLRAFYARDEKINEELTNP